MAALPVTAAEAAASAVTRGKLDTAFKEGTSGGVVLAGPVALTTIPAVVLDLYEIARLASLQSPLPSYTVASVPSASPAGMMIYVSNEAGGAVPAFSDGTSWRRVTDRAVIS